MTAKQVGLEDGEYADGYNVENAAPADAADRRADDAADCVRHSAFDVFRLGCKKCQGNRGDAADDDRSEPERQSHIARHHIDDGGDVDHGDVGQSRVEIHAEIGVGASREVTTKPSGQNGDHFEDAADKGDFHHELLGVFFADECGDDDARQSRS